MIIVAKFASVCPCCSSRIAVGEKVEWTKGNKARHAVCAQAPGAVSAPSRQVARTARSSYDSTRSLFRRRYGWDGVVGSASYYSSGLYDEES